MKNLLLIGILISVCSLGHAATNPVIIKSTQSCRDGVCNFNACDVSKANSSSSTQPNSLFSKNIHWQEYTADTIAKLKSTHQLILLFIKKEVCPWSKKMVKSTFENPSVISQINDSFVPFYMEFTEDNPIAIQYQVTAVPTTIIIDLNGKVIKEVAGYIDSPAMSILLSEVTKSSKKE